MRKIQNRVSEFEALFRIISEYAQVGYANYNLYNKEGYAQNVWLRNYGEGDSAQIVDVIGKYRHIHPEDRKPLLDLLTRFSAGEVQSATAICRVQHDDGRKTWIKTHLICRDYRPGEQVIDMLGINYDITALKQTEQELIAAKERAEESNKLKSAFLANMSHEIRTPLNAIVGFSSLMQGEELSQEERAEYCAIVVNNSEMLLTLLNDILDISSLECGKIKFNCSSEEIVQVCQHVLMTTAHTRQEGVEGRLECAVGSYMLVTDVHRLSQILINLLTNAGKFTSQGSITLGVEIDEAHREVLFSVADTGPGIPLDKQEMVFNRFEKLDGNKKKGTGLGLAICRQIAMIFGGRIWVDPTYTAGARFVFAHPIDIRFPEDGENRGGVSPLEAPGSSR